MRIPFETGIVLTALLAFALQVHARPDAQVLVDWNARIFAAAEAEDRFLALKGVRTAAMMHLAIHDAINCVERRYGVYILHADGNRADALAAATQAAYAIAVDQYPARRGEWDARRTRWLDEIDDGAAKDKGIALGNAAAAAVLVRRANDGWNGEAAYQFHPMAPGVYAEFNEHSGTPQGFVFGAGWAVVKPFALQSPSQFRSPPPPDIRSAEYTHAFDEVKELGRFGSRSRTADQTHLAMWWKDFAENSHNRLARQLVTVEQPDLWIAARLFALLNVSLMDAYISVFDNKFHYNHWRPFTAIRWADHDGNPATVVDADWNNTHRHTYAFPSYPSAHGTACAAAMTVFADTFGNERYFKMSTPQVDAAGPMSEKIPMKPPTRSYDSFSAAARECALSRVYLGIHFRYDSIEGVRLGRRIGDYITRRYLRAANWRRAALGSIELEYQLRGTGEPVVFVHGGIFADWFEPLVSEPALRDAHRLLTYHRLGYAGSSRASDNATIPAQARQLGELLAHLSLRRVHVVGHSSGALIAIQLALDSPATVSSLTLLEPALTIAGNSSPGILSAVASYRSGRRDIAIDAFMRAVAGQGYRATLDRVLPRAMDQAMTDAPTFFEQELPAVRAWSFTTDEAQGLRAPVLLVTGGLSDEISPIWRQRQELLLRLIPRAEPYILPGATHLLQLQNPGDLARRIAAFTAARKRRMATWRPGGVVLRSCADLIQCQRQTWRPHEIVTPLHSSSSLVGDARPLAGR
jgi:pimeloyl-ACP methyl ester carboxylesterase/membrane-associated phospholipid phosphatase